VDNNLLLFPPITDIRIISIGDKRVRDSELSSQAAQEIIKQAKEIIPDSVKTFQLHSNEQQSGEVAKAFFKIIRMTEGHASKIKVAKIPEVVMHIMDSSKLDLALVIVYQGFARTAENQKDQYILGRGVNFFSLGMVNITPIESSAAMLCFFIDKKNKKIGYYKKTSTREMKPMEPKVIRSLVYHSIMSYYQLRK
jgi:hypothetical protein